MDISHSLMILIFPPTGNLFSTNTFSFSPPNVVGAGAGSLPFRLIPRIEVFFRKVSYLLFLLLVLMKSYKDRTSNWNGRQFQHMSEIIIHSVALKILNFYCPKTKVGPNPSNTFYLRVFLTSGELDKWS